MFLLAAQLALGAFIAPARAQGSFEASRAAGAPALQMKFRAFRLRRNPFNNNAELAACLRAPGCHRLGVVAHRTSGFTAPENSRDGLRQAIASGIPLIETDIHSTQDGVWVMIHDKHLDRTTNLKGLISRRNWDELKDVRLPNGESLPRFQDLYALSRGRSVLVLDLKVDVVQAMADWISQNGSFDDLIFFASDAPTLASCARVRAQYPKMMVMARVEDGMNWGKILSVYGGKLPLLVHPNFPSPDLAKILHKQGTKLYATAVNHDHLPRWRDDIARLLILRGSDLIDTDDPLWLQEVVAGLRGHRNLVQR